MARGLAVESRGGGPLSLLAAMVCALAACSDAGSDPDEPPDVPTTANEGAAGDGAVGAAGQAAAEGASEGPGSGTADEGPPASTAREDTGGAVAGGCGADLPLEQTFDPARAAHGQALFRSETLTPGVVPELVIRNLWVAWGVLPPASDEDFWRQARERYGFVESSYDNGGLPLGMRREGANVAFNCLLCHASDLTGTAVVGAPNHRLDLESFYDDLIVMRDLAPTLGLPFLPVPFDLDGFTHAAGAQDAFGLGFRFAGLAIEGADRSFGPQRAPAWWQLAHKQCAFADGGGDASSHRSMMATLVAFGTTPDQLVARDEDFIEIAHYLLSLEPPCWTLTELDPERLQRGRESFDAECAACHGIHSGRAASYPDMVVSLDEVGTDPVRAQRFTAVEAAGLNASFFGDPPFEATGGYLAPPLVGIWARAPYFHNGSVPDLMAVLDPAQRPALWRRTQVDGSDFDPERVGIRHEVVSVAPDPDTREGRRVYDTTREGMGNGGHAFGATLTPDQRLDLLEYLRSL